MLRQIDLVFLLLALGPAYAVAPSDAVNVESYGAVADGHTDNTHAVQAALAKLHKGQTLYFPCTAGSYYVVNSPIDFGGLQYTHVAASGPGCVLDYQGSVAQPYAFSFVGARVVDIRNMDFHSADTAAPPQTVLLLGRRSSSELSGRFEFNGVTVEGYATKALVYSIASEEDTWLEASLILNGGGALYAFYTASSDELDIANLPTASNLSLWMQNFHISDYSPAIDSRHILVYDGGLASAAGNHTYRDGYLGSKNGTAFTFSANGAGATSWMSLTVDSNRFENGYQMFDFTGGGSFGDVSITNNKTAGVSRYLIHLPTTCYNCTFMGNTMSQSDRHTSCTSVFGTLRNSFLSENYPMTIAHIVSSNVFNRAEGTLQLGSANANVPCSAGKEGAMRYIAGEGARDGTFQVCQRRSGEYVWVTH